MLFLVVSTDFRVVELMNVIVSSTILTSLPAWCTAVGMMSSVGVLTVVVLLLMILLSLLLLLLMLLLLLLLLVLLVVVLVVLVVTVLVLVSVGVVSVTSSLVDDGSSVVLVLSVQILTSVSDDDNIIGVVATLIEFGLPIITSKVGVLVVIDGKGTIILFSSRTGLGVVLFLT